MLKVNIHKLDTWDSNEIFILREDLLPIACGGNKVRIALKLLEDAKSKGADTIVGYGNSRSNMCRVLAMLCAKYELRCLIVSPSDDSGERFETTNSKIVQKCGASIITCQKNAVISDVVEEALDSVCSLGNVPYYIFGNKFGKGNESVLCAAYKEVAEQLLDWQRESSVGLNRISLAVGTGSTYGGILNGLRENESKICLTGFTIARSIDKCIDCMTSYSIFESDISDIALNGGYGKSSSQEIEFLNKAAKSYSIIFDSTYSGKALWGLYNYIQKYKIRNEKILFVHTGSLPLALDTFCGG